MQKVIIVKFDSFVKKDIVFEEIKIDNLNKLLNDGYKVVQFHQLTPNDQESFVTFTFILEKAD